MSNPKQLAAERATDSVEDGMVVGLGTGSTAYYAIVKLGEKVKNGLQIACVSTSERSSILARDLLLPLTDFSRVGHIDVTIDGADEVDPAFNLTKGGGGALLREKFIASVTRREIIVVDESKIKAKLGGFPLPVEIVPFGWQVTVKRLGDLGSRPTLRKTGTQPFETDNRNYIVDCAFQEIEDPAALERQILNICGVVECGLFIGLAHRIIIGRSDGTIEEKEAGGRRERA